MHARSGREVNIGCRKIMQMRFNRDYRELGWKGCENNRSTCTSPNQSLYVAYMMCGPYYYVIAQGWRDASLGFNALYTLDCRISAGCRGSKQLNTLIVRHIYFPCYRVHSAYTGLLAFCPQLWLQALQMLAYDARVAQGQFPSIVQTREAWDFKLIVRWPDASTLGLQNSTRPWSLNRAWFNVECLQDNDIVQYLWWRGGQRREKSESP
jgi:hypothetical protein